MDTGDQGEAPSERTVGNSASFPMPKYQHSAELGANSEPFRCLDFI